MNIAVGNVLMYRLFDGATVNQSFQIRFCLLIRFSHHFADDAVRRGIRPVWQRKLRNLVVTVIYIIDDAPRVIDFDVIEQITVIPPLHFRQLLLQIIVGKHFLYFDFCKSEAVAVFGTQNAVNFQIVQPRKDAFFADSKAACNYTFFKIRVCLECRFKERADKVNHLVIKAPEIRVFQRYIVLVDEDEGAFSMIFKKAL